MSTISSQGGQRLQTVERALDVLGLFSSAVVQLTTAEVVLQLGVPRSRVARLLKTLEVGRFLERHSGTYRLGPALLELGALYKRSNPVLAFADGILREIAEQTGHTAYFGSVNRGEAVILAKHEGARPVRFVWDVGDRLPVTTTSFGKAVLMTLPEEELVRCLDTNALAPLTAQSITDSEILQAEFAAARARGWATANGESYPGICAVGAPVIGSSPVPRYGLSLSFLHLSEAEPRFDELASVVLEGAARLSLHMRASEVLEPGGRDRALPSLEEFPLPGTENGLVKVVV